MWTDRNVRIIKEGKNLRRRWIIGLIGSFVSRKNQLRLTSGIFLPEHNRCPLTRIKCGAEKKLWATGHTLTPIGLERFLQKSTQAVASPLAAKMSTFPPKVPRSNIQHWKYRFGKT